MQFGPQKASSYSYQKGKLPMTKDDMIKKVTREWTEAFVTSRKVAIEKEAERRLAFLKELELNPPEL